ncbi:MAG: hypothetical protein ACR2PT_08000 [Endozoicomonas sp.]
MFNRTCRFCLRYSYLWLLVLGVSGYPGVGLALDTADSVSNTSLFIADCKDFSQKHCKFITAAIIGPHWALLQQNSLSNCKTYTREAPQKRGGCQALYKDSTGHLNSIPATRVWLQKEAKGGLYSHVQPEEPQEVLSFTKADQQLAIIEFDELHNLIDNEGLNSSELDFSFNFKSSSRGELAFIHVSSESELLRKSEEVTLYPCPWIDLGWVAGVMRHSTSSRIPNSFFGPVFSLSSGTPKLVGQITYTTPEKKHLFFSNIQKSETFIRRVLSPWRWKPIEKALPPDSKKTLDTLDVASSKEGAIYICRNPDSGTPGMLKHDKKDHVCITILQNHAPIETKNGYEVLTGRGTDRLHWIRFVDSLGDGQKKPCEFNGQPTSNTSGMVSWKMCPVDSASDYSKHEGKLYFDLSIWNVCMVSSKRQYAIGRKSEIDNSCLYPLWIDGKWQVKAATDFFVISHIK